MWSCIILLDSRGKLLISRSYRGDLLIKKIVKYFNEAILEVEDLDSKPPIFQYEELTFGFIKHDNIYSKKI
jgi:AP-1 complex subunit mu